MRHRQVDKSLTGTGEVFIVFREPAVSAQPSQRTLNDPAFGLHHEAFRARFTSNYVHHPQVALRVITNTYSDSGNRIQEVQSVNQGQAAQIYTSTLEYDGANRLVTYVDSINVDARYIYNGDGLRLRKEGGTTLNTPITYTWDIQGIGSGGLPLLLREDETENLHLNGTRTVMYAYGLGSTPLWEAAYPYIYDNPNGTKGTPTSTIAKDRPEAVDNLAYYLPDAQGSVRLVVGSDGASAFHLEAVYDYSAYGTRQCGMAFNTSGCEANPSFGYTGQYQDGESGLVYLRNRYYDPQTQQFISRDPLVGVTGQPYAYAYDNPVNYSDPAGLEGGSNQKLPPMVEGPGGTWVQATFEGFWMQGAPAALGGAGLEGGLPEGPVSIRNRSTGGTRPRYDRANGRGVYVGKDSKGTVRYVGQGDAPSRVANHRNNKREPVNADLTWQIVANNNLTKAEARGLEQLLIYYYGGKDGGQLRNDDNGAGPRNSSLDEYLSAGRPLLQEALEIIQNGP